VIARRRAKAPPPIAAPSTMPAIDLQALNIDALRSRLGELRRYL
jgi:hypothetical protein